MTVSWDDRTPGRWTSRAAVVLTVVAVGLLAVALLVGVRATEDATVRPAVSATEGKAS